jgi:hypothetical protein
MDGEHRNVLGDDRHTWVASKAADNASGVQFVQASRSDSNAMLAEEGLSIRGRL